MSVTPAIWPRPAQHLRAERPDHPMLYFSPASLQDSFRRFQRGFPGLVTYAVKANDSRIVLENLVTAGMEAFDVASPAEMRKVRAVSPEAVLHYHNPVRSRDEIAQALEMGVASWSVDCVSELDKLIAGGVPAGAEVSARLRLPVAGAIYDFGAKFGADPVECAALLRAVAAAGFTASMTFHPGTQCSDPAAWVAYIRAAAEVSERAGIALARLNVGGGFPSHRTGGAPDLEEIFAAIRQAVADAFGTATPALVCEPGRAMVAEAMTLACRIKAIRADGSVFLNDGIYGGLAEMPVMGLTDRLAVLGPDGRPRRGTPFPVTVFGPTCDSLDRLPGEVGLPDDAAEGDYVLFHGLGAYSTATMTRFNGYGLIGVTTVDRPL